MRGGAIPGCAEAIAERPTLVAFVERMSARIAEVESGASDEETG